MSWSKWFALKSYVRSSYWIIPCIALFLEQLALRGSLAIDVNNSWVPVWPLGHAGTLTALQTIVTMALSYIVFTFGSMLIAIQVASAQMTPRIIATTLLQDNIIRSTVGLFIFTILFTIGTVSRIETSVPSLSVWISTILGLVSLVAFLYLIDYAARLLRPVSIIWKVAEQGFGVIDTVYPKVQETDQSVVARQELAAPDRVIYHSGTSAIVLAVDLKALLAEAQRADCIIQLAARVGDFVAIAQPLFFLHGKASAINNRHLIGAIAFGRERTIEQDSTFAFRIIVDIAIKALSKAINDPTTAVTAIDQLQRLLRVVGERQLFNENITDKDGRLRVIFPTPNWEDFVQLSCREIRLYGAENYQIARRLRAMLENLEKTLPASRKPALSLEIDLLDRTIDKVYFLKEDMALARIPDSQGLGGASKN
jgi:uncharacterized membrane protein